MSYESTDLPTSSAQIKINRGSRPPIRFGGSAGSIERVSVNLSSKAYNDLERLYERTGISKTDLVNRAIQVYHFIDAQISGGYDLILRNKDTREDQILRII